MGSTWSFFFGSRICALDNRWVVEGESWIFQGTICSRDAYESLKVSSGMRKPKFGEFFNCSHYCVQCWGASLNPYATHRTNWFCSELGDWIGSGTSHIGMQKLEGNLDSAPSLFDPLFLNKWLEVTIQADTTWLFRWNFAFRNQVQAWQQVFWGICHKVWMVVCVSHG